MPAPKTASPNSKPQKRNAKAQTSMEYLSTYGWALLVIIIVLIALFSIGVFNPSSSTSLAQPGNCWVSRPNGPGSTTFITLAGVCNGIKPQFVTQFNGASSYITTSTYPIANLPTYTINMWVYLMSTSVTLLMGYTDNVDGTIGCASYYINANPVTIGTWNQYYTPSNWETSASGIYIPTGSWHMLTVTLSGGSTGSDGAGIGTLTVYLDGGSANTVGGQSLSSSVPVPLFQIGGASPSCPGTLTGSLNGNMANVQIYNTTLSAGEVQALYSEGIGGAPLVLQNLVGWWSLNGNFNDYSGNGNNGVPTSIAMNSTWVSKYTGP
jgi:hypothetical protein